MFGSDETTGNIGRLMAVGRTAPDGRTLLESLCARLHGGAVLAVGDYRYNQDDVGGGPEQAAPLVASGHLGTAMQLTATVT